MDTNDENFEAYFSGIMSEKEIKQFTVDLEADPSLREAYDLFVAVKKSTSSIERDKMRLLLEDVDIETFSSEKPAHIENPQAKRTILPWLIGTIFLAVIIYFAYSSMFTSTSPDQLYASNYETYQVQALRGASSADFKQAYASGDYANFLKIVPQENKSSEINMMLANALMQTDAFSDAEQALLAISDESSLREQKYWYLGLVSLKMGKEKKARSYFQKLMDISTYKNKEIENILPHLSE